MLTQVIGQFLPSAVGVAISPIPIIAVVLMLGTPKARTDGPAFAAGWIVGMVAVVLVVVRSWVQEQVAYPAVEAGAPHTDSRSRSKEFPPADN